MKVSFIWDERNHYVARFMIYAYNFVLIESTFASARKICLCYIQTLSSLDTNDLDWSICSRVSLQIPSPSTSVSLTVDKNSSRNALS